MQEFTGTQYLKIDIANSFGLDKKVWADRLAWFEQNENQLEQLHPKAKEPALFYAGIQAWKQAKRGEPSGYPISLDATASGMQLLACLTTDRKAAELCNVISTGKREDAYTLLYDHLLGKVGGSSQLTREQTKDAIMTSLYSSERIPKETFGEMLPSYHETMEERAPLCWDLNQAFLAIWDPNVLSHDWVMPDNFHVHVKVMGSVVEPVNFMGGLYEVPRKLQMPTKKGRSLGANTVHSLDGMIVREITRRCSYDPIRIATLKAYFRGDAIMMDVKSQKDRELCEILWGHYQASGYLSARILDHLDPYTLQDHEDWHAPIEELLDSLPAKPFTVLSVHDCFRVLPNYGNDIRKQYIRQLYEVARSDLLSFMLSQILKRPVKLGKLDPTLAQDILNTEYALS